MSNVHTIALHRIPWIFWEQGVTSGPIGRMHRCASEKLCITDPNGLLFLSKKLRPDQYFYLGATESNWSIPKSGFIDRATTPSVSIDSKNPYSSFLELTADPEGPTRFQEPETVVWRTKIRSLGSCTHASGCSMVPRTRASNPNGCTRHQSSRIDNAKRYQNKLDRTS